MRLVVYPRRILALLLLLLVAAWSNDYVIKEFDSMEEAEETDFIRAGASGFKEVKPTDIKKGSLVMRVKFEDPFEEIIEYQLFKGEATSQTSSLRRFTIEGMSQSDLAKAKVYYNQGASSEDDLALVYFDGNGILVDDDAENLYIQQSGKMVKLKKSDSRPMQIRISTTPSGATVYLNDASKGSTPTTITIAGEESVLLKVAKEGFYSSYMSVKPKPGATASESVTLQKRPTLDDPLPMFNTRHKNLKDKKDSDRLAELKTEVETERDGWSDKVSELTEQIASKAPSASQKSGESDETFEKRTAAASADLDAIVQELTSQGQKTVSALDALAQAIETSIEELSQMAAVVPIPDPLDDDEDDDDGREDDEDDDDDYESVAESSRAVSDENEDEYSFSAVTDAFGRSDDIKKYVGYTLIAAAVGTAVMMGMEWMYVSKSQEALDKTQALLDEEMRNINDCRRGDIEKCTADPNYDPDGDEPYKGTAMAELLLDKRNLNKQNLDDHSTMRLIWGISAGATTLGAIFLLAVPF